MKFNRSVYGLILFIVTGCSPTNSLNQLKAIEFIDNTITISNKTSTKNDGGSFRIIYTKQCAIYEVWNIKYEVKKSTIINKEVINEIYPTKDTVFKYFVVRDNDRMGLAYNGLQIKENGAKFQLDSLLERLTINESNLKIFSLDLGVPVKIEKSGTSNRLEKYYTKNVDGEPDSIYRYYNSKLKRIKFSFAPKLDKLHKSKLYKTRFIYIPKNRPREELITEIKEIKLNNPKEILGLFERFEKDSKRLNLK